MMKLNKTTLAALAALTLTACSDQADFTQADVINAAVENAERPIGFDTYLGGTATTRAEAPKTYQGGTIINGDYDAPAEGGGSSQKLKNTSFGVFSYYTENKLYTHNDYKANFMYNEHISWSESSPSKTWTYAPAKYWPNGIDVANAANDPSNTATQAGAQYLSFFAYAPYKGVKATANEYPSSQEYGDVPNGSNTDFVKTDNYTDARNTTQGVVGMVKNSYTQDPWVNYVMKKENGALTTAATGGIDLLWGLRGQYVYDETDGGDSKVDELGNVYNTDLTKQSVPERVRFLFKHALAKLGGSKQSTTSTAVNPAQSGLKVVVDVDYNSAKTGQGESKQTDYFAADFSNTKTLVTIKSVKLRDPFTYTVTEDATNAITDEGSNLNTHGWFNLATGLWDKTGHDVHNLSAEPKVAGGATFNLTVKNDQLNKLIKEVNVQAWNVSVSDGDPKRLKDGGDEWYQNSEEDYPVGVKVEKAYDVYSNSNNPGIMLIPGGSQSIYVTVDYFVRTADKKLDAGYTQVEQIITNKVDLTGLEANKFYTLVMHLGMTSVKFEAVVADWANSTGAVYDENGEVVDDSNIDKKSIWLPSNVVNTTSITADAGTKHRTVTIADTRTSYTLHLTGLTPGHTVEVTKTGAGLSDATVTPIYSEDVIPSDGKLDISITGISPNTSASPVENTITIKDKVSDGVYVTANETKVTIIQEACRLILTPNVTSIPYNGSIEIKATHADGSAFTGIATNDVTVTNGGSTPTISVSGNTITVTPEANLTSANKMITVSVTTGGVTSEEAVKVVQAAYPGDLYVALTTEGNIPAAGGESNKKALSVKLNGVTVNPTGTPHYVVTISDSWLTYDGNGNLTATEKTDAGTRTATVTVTYNDGTGTHTGVITVTQNGTGA